MKMQTKNIALCTGFVATLVVASATAAPVIYEPFADLQTTITGNTPGTGLTGVWASNSTSGAFSIVGSSLSYGSQPTTGGSARYVHPTGLNTTGNINATISTLTGAGTPGSLANAGLLADGATLWFSVMHKVVTNTSDDRAAFALASNNLSTNTNFNGTTTQGVGFAISSTGNLTARVTTAGSTHVDGTNINRFGAGVPETILIVGKITWGANDTVELYLPDTSMNLGTVKSTATAAVDQSVFDVVTLFSRMQGGGTATVPSPSTSTDMSYDEIRFGATVGDVLVPEPGSLALMGLGMLCVLQRRRHI